MYCDHCHGKIGAQLDTPVTVLREITVPASSEMLAAPPPSKRETLTRLSVVACSMLLLLLAIAFFVMSVHSSNVHQVMLMGLGLLLLGACEVVWTARTRKAVIGSFVVAGAGVALVSIIVALIGASM